jgi:hypothetical protein
VSGRVAMVQLHAHGRSYGRVRIRWLTITSRCRPLLRRVTEVTNATHA